MPVSRLVIPFFIVFSGSTMCVSRKVVLLSRFPVCVVPAVHGVSSCGKLSQRSYHVHEADQPLPHRRCLSGMALDPRNLDLCVIQVRIAAYTGGRDDANTAT